MVFHDAITMDVQSDSCRVRYFRGRVSNFDQSESRKHSFLASDWLKFETLPRKYRTLYLDTYKLKFLERCGTVSLIIQLTRANYELTVHATISVNVRVNYKSVFLDHGQFCINNGRSVEFGLVLQLWAICQCLARS